MSQGDEAPETEEGNEKWREAPDLQHKSCQLTVYEGEKIRLHDEGGAQSCR